MIDLTKITQPFGTLDAETQKALKASGGPYEKLTGGEWWPTGQIGWNPNTIYRLKPERSAEEVLKLIRAI